MELFKLLVEWKWCEEQEEAEEAEILINSQGEGKLLAGTSNDTIYIVNYLCSVGPMMDLPAALRDSADQTMLNWREERETQWVKENEKVLRELAHDRQKTLLKLEELRAEMLELIDKFNDKMDPVYAQAEENCLPGSLLNWDNRRIIEPQKYLLSFLDLEDLGIEEIRYEDH